MLFALLLVSITASALAQAPPTSRFQFKEEGAGQALNCETAPCRNVLPGAVRFEQVEGKPYLAGLDDAGETVGWVVRSTDVTDRNAYSGKPIVNLVGLDLEGRFTGVEVLHHSEPILLVGIPEQALIDFADFYKGHSAEEMFQVGGSGDSAIDVISGATVTVLAENATVVETARRMGADVGVVADVDRVPGHFVEAEPWSWSTLVRKGALGHLVVSQEAMGEAPSDVPFVDLWFGIADAPQVGIPLMGAREHAWSVSQLAEDEHLFVVLNAGTASFKGSGFVRGGIFDRIRVEQGMRTLMFRDKDYTKLGSPAIDDAPHFGEAGLFIARDNQLDPGASYDFVFLGSTYSGAGGFDRDFVTFSETHRTPRSVYVLDGPDPESAVWKAAWATSWPKTLVVTLYLLAVAGVFAGRRWTTKHTASLKRLHTGFLLTSFFGLGVGLHVQPSVTQILTVAGATRGEWDWGLFLSDPTLFVSWIFIAIVTLIWGRGVFCGWTCPYGALSELLFKVGKAVGLPHYELPDAIHLRLRYLRYVIMGGLLIVFFYNSELGEMMAEVEPFKTTFFVAPWTRQWPLLAWWVALLGASVFVFRPFCRYVCPMGAALAIPSSIRLSGPYRRDFCSQCKICTKTCEPRAFRPDGTIDPRECLSCMECEANWRDDDVCPPLVRQKRGLGEKKGSSSAA